MTVIRPNSISGITSITGNGGDISIFRADGTACDLTINNIVGAAATFTGVVSYEDVTNVDSVGVITARSGISVTSGSIAINTTGGNEKLNVHGAIRSSTSSANFNAGLEGTLVDYDLSNNVSRIGHVNGASGSARPLAFLSGGTERLRIDSGGRILKGIQTARGNYANNTSGVQFGFQIEATTGTDSTLSLIRSSNDANDGGIFIGKTRGSVGGSTVVQAGDDLGTITFGGADGTSLQFGAQIIAEVQSGVGNDDMPTDLIFKTNGGSTSTAERMRISSAGYLTKPNTPFFSVYGVGSNQTYNSGDDITFENALQNVGNHFKMTSGTGQYQRFIAPVAGVYIFTFGFFPNSASSCRIQLNVNGNNQTNPYLSGSFSNWGTGSPAPMGSQMLKLSASDYVTVRVTGGTLSNTYDGHTGFQGFLLG